MAPSSTAPGEGPNDAAIPADTKGGSLQEASAFLDSITTRLSERSDAEIAEVGRVTYTTWVDGGYKDPTISTQEIKSAVGLELKSLGVASGSAIYDPVQKALWVDGTYAYWMSLSRKPYGLEDKGDERRLGRPDKGQVEAGLSVGTCSPGWLVRTASGEWAAVRSTGDKRESPWVLTMRDFGNTPVKQDPNNTGIRCLPAG